MTRPLEEAANELDPIDNLYDTNQRLLAEITHLRKHVQAAEADAMEWAQLADKQKAENERLRKRLGEFANPDNWDHVDENHWVWHGFPPFEDATWTLLGKDQPRPQPQQRHG